jgi:hypothetical protein
MLLSQAMEGFRIDRLANGYSPSTIKLYTGNLRVLIEFLDDKEIEKISHQDLVDFFYFLRTDYKPRRLSGDTRPLSPAAVDNYI